MPVDYPHAADHIITNRSNFTVPASPRKIDRIIIHVAVGSYAGSLNWAQINPNGDSFHYIAGRSGAIAQAVREANIAHQAGYWPMNVRSVGIEHADLQQWASADWWTDDQIEASAKLTAYLCRKYRIPADRKHILAHNEVPTVERPCPGPHFPWAMLMDLVLEELGELAVWRGSRWAWTQDDSAPAPAVLTYEGRDTWRVERVYSNPERLPEMSRWAWTQDDSAPAPAVLTYNEEPAWKVTRI